MDTSQGTETWIAEYNRLLNRCAAITDKAGRSESRLAFEILIDLLRHVDDCHDDVIFFADEGEAWSVGVEWRKVLPAWFAILAETAEAGEYAKGALEPIQRFVGHDKAWFLRKAKSLANAAQKKALQERQKKK